MVDIKIKCSDKEVIASGVFVTLGNSVNLISFNEEGETLNLEISFSEDNENKKSRVEYRPNEDNTVLVMKFFNFKNALGTALNEPIGIANINNKQIYLKVWINSINEKSKKVVYTFYKGEANA